MKTTKKPLTDKEFMKIAQKAAYEKYFTIEGIGKTSGIFSKTDDSYLGSDWSHLRPFIERGVTEQFQATGSHGKTAQIAYNPKLKAWYGWSNRAVSGFKIGHKVKKGDCTLSSGWTKDAPQYKADLKRIAKYPAGFIAKTLDDCKQLAILFANSVS
jgi:hypothetical protein